MVTIQRHTVLQTQADGTEYEIEFDQDQILVSGRWVAVAAKSRGAGVAFTRGQIPRSWLGQIARAMDERDGGPYPERVLNVHGKRTRAREVVDYGDQGAADAGRHETSGDISGDRGTR